MKVEWQYLILMAVSIGFGVYYYFTGSVTISDVHTLFLLGGGILTAVIFIFTKVEVGSLKSSNFLIQASLGNFLLGLPYIRGVPMRIVQLQPTEIFVAVASEEIFRIGSAIWLEETVGKGFGLTMSAIVFALMHMYWHPAQWLFAIFGGALLSGLLYVFESQTACVVTHYAYDLLVLGWLPSTIFFIVSAVMIVLGYALTRRKK